MNWVAWCDWIEERLYEPSTWAGVGCGLVGMGVIFANEAVVFVGIIIGSIAMIIREKGEK